MPITAIATTLHPYLYTLSYTHVDEKQPIRNQRNAIVDMIEINVIE